MLEASHNAELPEIPAKRYFTIGEVSELCEVKPHVLRYWEQEFSQLKPVKRRGNRRYYQRQDVLLIRQIRALLYEQGFTIGGARQQMAGGVAAAAVVATATAPEHESAPGSGKTSALRSEMIREMIEEIEEALGYLS
jgi:DNA-binding transcriptional MerR regulator